MDDTLFKKIITKYGETNILGFGFDNSANKVFCKGEFTLASCYESDIECVHFLGMDIKGNLLHILKPIFTIQAIMVRDKNVPFEAYDRDHISG